MIAAGVLKALGRSTAGLTDAELATLLGKRHQQINQTCRLLADQGVIVRDGSFGLITNRLAARGADPSPTVRAPRPSSSPEHDWTWEGNVQARVVAHLSQTGWNIISVADTARREPGIDVVAERDGRRLLLEVKGWPSTTYSRGERAGQPKPTQPTLQATHWFAEGLTTLIRRGSSPGAALALVLPDKPRYRTLLAQARWAIERLEMTIYLVTEDGSVLTWQKEN
jgi:hypothetical protein